jgi:hypothetical protein
MALQNERVSRHLRRQVVVIKSDNYLFQTGLCKLLEIKDSDIRITTLMQCHDAVDKGIHIGGAFSATIPMVSWLFPEFRAEEFQVN